MSFPGGRNAIFGDASIAPSWRGRSVDARIRQLAISAPSAPAMTDGVSTISYAELETRVHAIAVSLAAAGVVRGDFVAVYAARQTDVVAVLLGVHRAGAAYVPIDVELPAARVALMLDDCAPRVVVSDRPLPVTTHQCVVVPLERFAAGTRTAHPSDVLPLDDQLPAYVVYTSGSTGAPKGVVVSQRSLASYVDAANERFRIGPGDRVLQTHSFSFDASVAEVFLTLAVGATVVLPAQAVLGGASWFVEQIDALAVSVLNLPTAYWHGLVSDLDAGNIDLPSRIRLVIIGGQAARAASVNRWSARLGRGRLLLNEYGPTEATIGATIADLTDVHLAPGEPVPIGRPLTRVVAHVVDHEGGLVPDGSPGQLLLGGPQVAAGYHGRPELSSQRFVTDPTGATSDCFYRTGDVVVRLEDGQLAFVRRVDDQVKVRGFRIELGEIEAVFESHPAVREAVAVLAAGEDALVVHLVAEPGYAIDREELLAHGTEVLPVYAVPATIEVRAVLPRTPGGKPDRRALQRRRAPLSYAQERMWVLEQLDDHGQTYLEIVGRHVYGPLDVSVLCRAMDAVVARHEPLRTRVVTTEDGPVQEIDPPGPVAWTMSAHTGLAAGPARDDMASEFVVSLAPAHHDLERGPLLECFLLRFADDHHLIVLRVHHIVFDGGSVGLLFGDLATAYEACRQGVEPSFPPLPQRYGDFARAQRDAVERGDFDEDLAWWTNALAGLAPSLELPNDRPLVVDDLGTTGRAIMRDLPAGFEDAVVGLARRSGTTRNRVGLALFNLFLYDLTGQTDLLLGMATTERLTPESEPLVGLFVNTVPIRVDLPVGASLEEIVAIVRNSTADALAHRQVPLDLIVGRLREKGERLPHPLLPVSFEYRQPTPTDDLEFAGLTLARVRKPDKLTVGAKFTFDITIDRRATGPALIFRYDSARLARETAESMTDRFLELANDALDEPTKPLIATRSERMPRRVPRRGADSATSSVAAGAPDLLVPVLQSFRSVLGRDIGPDDDFFVRGGNSLMAVRLCSAIERDAGRRVALASLFELPTARLLAASLQQPTDLLGAPSQDQSLFVVLRAGDPSTSPPLYCVHPAGGQLFTYMSVVQGLPESLPVIGIKEYGWGRLRAEYRSVEGYAAHYVDAIMQHRPHGPIALTGHSVGGLLAFEMARLLVSRGREVNAVILIDAIVLGRPSIRRVPHRLWKTRVEGSRARVRDLMARRRSARGGVTIDAELLGRESERRGTMLQRRYRPGPYAGRVVCIRAIGVGESPAPDKYTHVWARVASSVEVVEVRGEHTRANSILSPENAPAVAAVIRRVLAGR